VLAFCRVLLVMIFVVGFVGCKSGTPVRSKGEVVVTTIVTKREDIPATFEYVGVAQSSHLVDILARVEGYLDNIAYREGQLVKEGELLFQIDPRPFQAPLAQAQAQEAQQKAVLWDAQRSTERLKPLFEQKAASRRDLDNALAKEDAAIASLDAAKAQVLQAELNLNYTTIKSPINGVSGMARYRVGSLVGPASTQALLTSVWAIDPIWVNFNVSEGDLLKYHMEAVKKRLQMPKDMNFSIEIEFSDGTVFPSKGFVDFADPSLKQDTGSMIVRAVLPNPDGLLRPGQFVRARLIGAIRPQAIAVPQKAVMQGKGGMFVYVVDKDNTVEMRYVKTGDWYNDFWIIDEGLEAGERVIVDGTNKVTVGAVVKATDAVGKSGL
jgi:membrane fusion protein (multidrug efflux system)